MEKLYLDKRSEYIAEIIFRTKKVFIQGIKEIFQNAIKINRSKRFLLRDFQFQLRGIASWTDDRIEEALFHFENIQDLEKILKNVIILNSKLFSLQQQISIKDLYELKFPTFRKFIHDTYLMIARECWRKPYLLYDQVDRSTYFNNMIELEKIVKTCIKNVLRNQTPLRNAAEHLSIDDAFFEQEDSNEKNECKEDNKKILEPIIEQDLSKDDETIDCSNLEKNHSKDDNNEQKHSKDDETIDCGDLEEIYNKDDELEHMHSKDDETIECSDLEEIHSKDDDHEHKHSKDDNIIDCNDLVQVHLKDYEQYGSIDYDLNEDESKASSKLNKDMKTEINKGTKKNKYRLSSKDISKRSILDKYEQYMQLNQVYYLLNKKKLIKK